VTVEALPVCVTPFTSLPVIVMVYVFDGVPFERVVTLIAELCADAPAESLAATEKLYCVAAVKPVTLYVGFVVVAIEVPF
jgi:hypothetical protein